MLQIVKVKQLLSALLVYIQEDFKNTPEEESFLYKVIGGIKDGNYDFYKQAKALYIRDENNPRRISIGYEYPKDKSSFPCYIIREPGKSKGPSNSIGKMTDAFTMIPSMIGESLVYRDSRQYSFDIMCMTDNMIESILMSEVMYALLLGSYDILANQYNTVEFSMKELMAENSFIPTPIFIRSIDLSLSSEEFVPPLIRPELLGKIIFEGTPY